MALLSDIDWLIILAVGGLLLLGKGDPQLLRTVGRWYGKVMHLKQELLSEVTREAGIPNLSTGQQLSIRGALLGLEPEDASRLSVPIAVARAPAALASIAAASYPLAPAMTWVNSVGPQQWSIASTRFPEFDGAVR
jgi:Sec-independent protein translocase protein TatA